VAKGGMALVATHQPLSVEVRHLKLGETPAKTEIVA
jgi:ABC-type transport system involved in cytochrome c biogenesis ATPase subunit